MARSKPRHKLGLSLFPFLAVLICVMGSLIMLMLITTNQLKKRTLARAIPVAIPAFEPAPQPAVVAEHTKIDVDALRAARDAALERRAAREAEWQQELANLAGARGERLTTLEQKQAELARLKAESEKAVAELEAIRARLADVTARRDDEAKSQETLAVEQGELLADITFAEQKIKQAEEANAQAKSQFAFVPYDGASGTTRRPIFIECTGKGMRFLPEDELVETTKLVGFTERFNPLIIGTRTLISYWSGTLDIKPEKVDTDLPYVLLLVRPSGSKEYYIARQLLSDLRQPFGYELIQEDYPLYMPKPDAGSKLALKAALEQAMRDRQEILSGIPSRPEMRGRVISAEDLELSPGSEEEPGTGQPGANPFGSGGSSPGGRAGTPASGTPGSGPLGTAGNSRARGVASRPGTGTGSGTGARGGNGLPGVRGQPIGDDAPFAEMGREPTAGETQARRGGGGQPGNGTGGGSGEPGGGKALDPDALFADGPRGSGATGTGSSRGPRGNGLSGVRGQPIGDDAPYAEMGREPNAGETQARRGGGQPGNGTGGGPGGLGGGSGEPGGGPGFGGGEGTFSNNDPGTDIGFVPDGTAVAGNGVTGNGRPGNGATGRAGARGTGTAGTGTRGTGVRGATGGTGARQGTPSGTGTSAAPDSEFAATGQRNGTGTGGTGARSTGTGGTGSRGTGNGQRGSGTGTQGGPSFLSGSPSNGTGDGIPDDELPAPGMRAAAAAEPRSRQRTRPSGHEEIARKRWGHAAGQIGLEKEIKILVTSERVIIGEPEFSIAAGAGEDREEFVKLVLAALDECSLRWGKPPANFYWIPYVRFRVYPGGNHIFERINPQLREWGLSTEVEFATDERPRPKPPAPLKP